MLGLLANTALAAVTGAIDPGRLADGQVVNLPQP